MLVDIHESARLQLERCVGWQRAFYVDKEAD